jgi:hypothetical protein
MNEWRLKWLMMMSIVAVVYRFCGRSREDAMRALTEMPPLMIEGSPNIITFEPNIITFEEVDLLLDDAGYPSTECARTRGDIDLT